VDEPDPCEDIGVDIVAEEYEPKFHNLP